MPVTTSRPPIVEAIGLRKSYGARLVLDDMTMTIRAAEIVGLLGPNGAGKTTTLSILATLLSPDAGELRIAGADPRREAASIRHKLGFVPQSIALFPSLSPLQNLELFARVHGIKKRTARGIAMRILDLAGLAERARDPIATLSGGMNRRLNLAVRWVNRLSCCCLTSQPPASIRNRVNAFLLRSAMLLRQEPRLLQYALYGRGRTPM